MEVVGTLIPHSKLMSLVAGLLGCGFTKSAARTTILTSPTGVSPGIPVLLMRDDEGTPLSLRTFPGAWFTGQSCACASTLFPDASDSMYANTTISFLALTRTAPSPPEFPESRALNVIDIWSTTTSKCPSLTLVTDTTC